jgi:hypothetical protein
MQIPKREPIILELSTIRFEFDVESIFNDIQNKDRISAFIIEIISQGHLERLDKEFDLLWSKFEYPEEYKHYVVGYILWNNQPISVNSTNHLNHILTLGNADKCITQIIEYHTSKSSELGIIHESN